MTIPPNEYTITLAEDDLEMILNALSYEHQTHTELTQDYRDALAALFELLDHVGTPYEGNDAEHG
jgi:hypothetical protein